MTLTAEQLTILNTTAEYVGVLNEGAIADIWNKILSKLSVGPTEQDARVASRDPELGELVTKKAPNGRWQTIYFDFGTLKEVLVTAYYVHNAQFNPDSNFTPEINNLIRATGWKKVFGSPNEEAVIQSLGPNPVVNRKLRYVQLATPQIVNSLKRDMDVEDIKDDWQRILGAIKLRLGEPVQAVPPEQPAQQPTNQALEQAPTQPSEAVQSTSEPAQTQAPVANKQAPVSFTPSGRPATSMFGIRPKAKMITTVSGGNKPAATPVEQPTPSAVETASQELPATEVHVTSTEVAPKLLAASEDKLTSFLNSSPPEQVAALIKSMAVSKKAKNKLLTLLLINKPLARDSKIEFDKLKIAAPEEIASKVAAINKLLNQALTAAPTQEVPQTSVQAAANAILGSDNYLDHKSYDKLIADALVEVRKEENKAFLNKWKN